MKKTLALLAVSSLVLAACGSSSSSSGSGSTTSSSAASKTTASSGGGAYGYGGGSASTTKTTSNTSSGGSAGSTISITMEDYKFSQKVISGKPGSTVKVNLKNTGANEHNFKIDGQKLADADVKPGGTGTATVKIPASGTVQFYCEYHRGLGMVGTVKAT
jgi:plastocyanin